VRASDITTAQVLSPLHPPPLKVADPNASDGVAVKDTMVPGA
jgi:hypothetical protein